MRVHNAVLKQAELVEEAFQTTGHGSAFMTREDEVVVLRLGRDGVGLLPDKVKQLVDRGFHMLVVDLTELAELDRAGLKLFLKSKQILENWEGWLGLCGVSKVGRELLESVGVEGEFRLYDDEAAAVKGLKAERAKAEAEDSGDSEEMEVPSEALESDDGIDDPDDADDGDEDDEIDAPSSAENPRPSTVSEELAAADLLDSSDLISEDLTGLDSADDDSDDGSGGDSDDDSELGADAFDSDEATPVVEDDAPLKLDWERSDALVSSADELSESNGTSGDIEVMSLDLEELDGLGGRVDAAIADGHRAVRVELALSRRMTVADVDHLRGARDELVGAGGSLKLSGLTDEALVWMRLKSFDKEFEIDGGAATATKAPRVRITDFDEESATLAGEGEGEDHQLLTVVELGSRAPTGLAAFVARLGEEEVGEVIFEGKGSRVAAVVKTSIKEALASAREAGVWVAVTGFGGRAEESLGSMLEGVGEVFEDLESAVRGCGQRRFAARPFESLEYGFNRVALDATAAAPTASEATPILRAESGEFDRDEMGVAESLTSSELEDLLARRDIEIARLRAEVDVLRESGGGSGASAALEAARLKEALSKEREGRDEVLAEVGRLEGQATELRRQLNDERRRVRDLEKIKDDAAKLERALKAATEAREEAVGRAKELEASQREASAGSEALEQRVTELEAQLEAAEERAREAEEELGTLRAESVEEAPKGTLLDLDSLPDDSASLKELLRQSEQDKLRILADAQAEIERLSRQEELLREELESAGEMIERLGKELELS